MGIIDTVIGVEMFAKGRLSNGVACDTPGCKNIFNLSRYDPQAHRIRDVAEFEAGWQYIDGRDVCPSCGSL